MKVDHWPKWIFCRFAQRYSSRYYCNIHDFGTARFYWSHLPMAPIHLNMEIWLHLV